MPITYCMSCGSENHYQSLRPKVCNQCGKSFGEKQSNSSAAKKKPAVVVEREEEEEETEEFDYSGVDFGDTVINCAKPSRASIKSLSGTVSPSDVVISNKKIPKNKLLTVKNILEKGKSSRGNSVDVGGDD